MSDEAKRGLGDGVYAEIERGMIKLTTSNGIEDLETIYLEPYVLANLIRYARAQADFDFPKEI